MTDISVVRLNSSNYQKESFFLNEKELASQFNCSYQDINAKNLILISNTHTQFDKLDHEILAKTLFLIHPNSGYDNISLEFIKSFNRPIFVGHSIRAQAVSQYILNCFFEQNNTTPFSNQWDTNRSWNRSLISKKTILIIGHGHIGKILSSVFKNLNAQVLVYDPYSSSTIDIQMLSNLYGDHLKSVDFVIPVASLNQTSYQMINRDFFKCLNPKATIINASRGQLIDQDALIEFLTINPKSFAYLDVFNNEPAEFSNFHQLKNIKLTSHIAGVFDELDQAILDFEKEVFEDYFGHDKINPNYSIQKKIRGSLLL